MIKWINKKRNQKGFTLIELIVVIAILGILAALAIPRLTGVQENANKKTIVANLKMIDSAIQVYAADNNVAVKTVQDTMLKSKPAEGSNPAEEGLIPNWPDVTGKQVYTVTDGVVSVNLNGVPGITDGDYTLEEALNDFKAVTPGGEG